MKTWHEQNPAWNYQLWRDGDFDWLKNRKLFRNAAEYVPADAVFQLKADIARYEILYRYGGFYADTDTECLAPIDDALTGHDELAASEDGNWIGNTYLACIPGHPVMETLIDRLPKNATRQRGRRANRISGPRYLTPIWKASSCHVAPVDLWFPYSYNDVKNGTVPDDYGDAWAVHHWQHTRTVLEGRNR